MPLNRRHFLLAGLGTLGAAATGCVPAAKSAVARPVLWPDANAAARAAAPLAPLAPAVAGTASASGAGAAYTLPTSAARPAYTANRPAAVPINGIIPRAAWTTAGLAGRNVVAMNGVARLTLHHEGSAPVTFTDTRSAAARLEQIRQTHTRDRGWADIGYHFIIDRAGRVYQGRDPRYQGAHVADTNPHNLGVMVLGNFEEQRPADAQVQSLARFVATLARTYRIPRTAIYTHQELKPTACPGRFLQPHIDTLRTRRAFG